MTSADPDCDTILPWPPMEHTPPCCVAAPHIEVTGLSVSYAGAEALRGVTLTIPRGCVTGIVGPSGCGKSTLLAVLNRMTDAIPACRVQGSVRIDRAEILAPDVDLRSLRRRVGLVFQRPNPLPISIADNILVPLRDHGLGDRRARDARLESVLRDVGLWEEVAHRLRRPATALSGGQQQRLCIARCLALQPEIVLMDEPCSALDPMAAEVIEDLIGGLRHRYTVVLVTHNLAQARRVTDHCAVFWHRPGAPSLIEMGPTRQVFEQPADDLTRLYVGGIRG
ncbi:MAG: phosphate ABC transporter ATP-binding protein [Phycisphaeraceae bacterium]|nr:phosphate ABC transporter ATP-binding protein [Phycisphaeraceae bacterium]